MIVVCGEALIDVVHNGDGTQRATPGGGPFNTARALARLGVPTAFLGHLSDDKVGRELAQLLVSDGASLELATIGNEKTTIAVADVDPEGLAEYQFLVEGTSAPHLTPEMVPARLAPNVKALHLGTLGMVLEPMASTLTDLVHREHDGRVVMLDLNIRLGLIPDDEFGAAMLAWLYTHDALKPDLRLEQADLKSALDYACLAAAITCSRPGADPPWKGEMPALRS
ncbi:MAG: hypothetical protein E6I39_05210 [Chloroflexi bacterium]|nr:MAG: hypothetical protein E6I39_05210 [Chloroflexota bacterium]